MEDSKRLSEAEIEALMRGVDTSRTSQLDMSGSESVKPFSFGTDDISVMGDYHALRIINEHFARLARRVFLPMLRIQPRLTAVVPEIKSFVEYSENIDSFMSLTIFRVEELRGSMMMSLPPDFISILTNSYYGGDLRINKVTRTEFTNTEERVIEIVTEGIGKVMEDAWVELMPVTLNTQTREINMQFASFVDSNELVVICSFMVQLPDIEPVSFDVIYPLQTLKPIASQLRSRIQTDISNEDENWRERLYDAVLNVPLQLDVRLDEPLIGAHKIAFLKVGDVIPIQLAENVEVFLSDRPFFTGEMGSVANQAAVSLKEYLT